MKTLTLISTSAVLSLAISTCQSPDSRKVTTQNPTKDDQAITGTILISGAYALYPFAIKWADAYKKLYPGVDIQVEKSGTGKGIDELLANEVDLAMVSRELNAMEMQKGLYQVPVAKDAVVLVMNADNPFREGVLSQGLSPRILAELFTGGKPYSWGQLLKTEAKEPVKIFTREDASGCAEILANFLLRTQAELKGEMVSGDEEMIKMIRANPGSLGYCNLSFAYDAETGNQIPGIQVVPVDMDMDGRVDRAEQSYGTKEEIYRAIWLGLYPKNLCRRLSFVYKDKPIDPKLRHFLKWVLTDGQELARNNGCCNFNNVETNLSLKSLE
ncbi:MAG: PstS family phosphate ABC transporter substrate-binding protein [Bacteroidota bacterium]